jgi:hypothetical protein
VDRKADDQHGRETDLAGAGGDADRQPLGEVVQPDRCRDRHPCAKGLAPDRELVGEHLGLLDGHRIGRATRDGGRLRGAHPPFDQGEAGGTRREAGAEQQREEHPDRQAAIALVEGVEPLLDDLEAMDKDLREEERENTHGEHCEGDACPLRHELDPPERQPEIDREPRQGPEEDCFPK